MRGRLYLEIRVVEVGRNDNKAHIECRFVFRQFGYPELSNEWKGGFIGVWDQTDPTGYGLSRTLIVDLPVAEPEDY